VIDIARRPFRRRGDARRHSDVSEPSQDARNSGDTE
jgi:hypothetical protein